MPVSVRHKGGAGYVYFHLLTKDPSLTGSPDDYYVSGNQSLPNGVYNTFISKETAPNVYNFIAYDFTGDGADDVLMANINAQTNPLIVNSFTIYKSRQNPNWQTDGTGMSIQFDALTAAPYTSAFNFTYNQIHSSGNFLFPGDFNGDGIQDMLTMLGASNGSYSAQIYYSQTNPQFLPIDATPTLTLPIAQWATADKVVVLDFNGDGKSDLMLVTGNFCEVVTLDGTYARQLYATYTSGYLNSNGLFYPGDFNGDQKTDLLIKNTGTNQWNVLISTGKHFNATGFTFDHTPNTAPFTGDQLTVADFNGDGKSDIYHGWQVVSNYSAYDVYYCRGYSFAGSGLSFVRVHQTLSTNLGAIPPVVGDANGDGRADVLNYKNATTPLDIFYFRKGGTETLLQKVRNGFGHQIEFNYQKLTDANSFYTQGQILANSYPLNAIQLPIYAVSAFNSQNGIGGTSTVQYNYTDAKLHRAGKGFLGFTRVTATNLTTGMKTVSTNQFNTSFFAPAPYQTATYLGNNLLSQTTLNNDWIDLNPGSRRYWYRVTGTSTTNAFEGRTASTAIQYDTYGNVTQSQADNNGVETTTTTTQYGQFGTPIPAKPTTTTTTKTRSGQPAYSVTTDFGYNAIGQLTNKTDFWGLPKSVATSYGYNTTGNVTNTSVAPAVMTPRTSSATFDGKGRFALTSTNVLGQTASATYDARWGKPLTSTGIDGLTMSYQYDAWGRTTQTTMPEGYAINQSWGWDQSNGAVYYNLVQHPGKPDVKSWMDVLGREVRKETEGFNGQTITQTQTYDPRGNVASATQPYLPGETVRTTTTSYDPYNRAESVNMTGIGTASVAYSYAGGNLTTTTTNPAGQVSSKVTDASGQTISATDHGGTLTYTYNAQGNLLTVSNGGAMPATHQYDAYGRQTQLTDQNAGTTTYEYNAAGELTSQTNANGHTHTMQYDVMGRIETRSGPDGPTPTTTEYYPAGSAAVNQIKKITGFAGNITDYAYDGYGRLTTSTETIDGTAYTTAYAYNTYGDVTSKSFPSGFGTNHAYDGNGYLTSIQNNTNSVTLYSAGNQNGLGQPLTYSLGNGKTSTNTYVNNMPTHYATPGVQDLALTWEYASGNLQSRQDAIKNKTESFTYDNLNRLTGSTIAGLAGQSINYSPNGNINTKTDAGQYSYLATKPNAVSAVTNSRTVISLLEQLISYTPFLQPQVLTENNYELTYTYGADYERIKGVLKQNNALLRTRYYTGAGYEKDIVNGGANRDIHYIDSPAGLIAIVVRENGSDTYHYVYSDHLGSLLTLTNSSGSVEAEQNFDAWGRRRNATTWTYTSVPARPDWLYRGYTGHEHLDPFVLINMNGRIYDPVVGRVLSPDNFVQDPFSTQDFNRYSYGFNNPLKYSDPDGNCPICLGFVVGFISGLISHAIQGTMPENFWQAVKPGLIGAATSALAPFADAAGQYAVGLLPKATPSVIKSLLSAGISGGLTGGITSGITGLNFLTSVGQSALLNTGFAGLGLGGRAIRRASARNANAEMGTTLLPEVDVRVSRSSKIGQALLRNQSEMRSLLYGSDAYHPWTFEGFSLSANFEANAFVGRGGLQFGVAFGPRDVGFYAGAGGGMGLSTELPGVGGGLNFNFHDTYGNADVLNGLGGTDMGYGATVGPVSVGYSRSAIRAPGGYFMADPRSGVNTYSFGPGGGFGINHGISQSGIWRLSSLFNRK